VSTPATPEACPTCRGGGLTNNCKRLLEEGSLCLECNLGKEAHIMTPGFPHTFESADPTPAGAELAAYPLDGPDGALFKDEPTEPAGHKFTVPTTALYEETLTINNEVVSRQLVELPTEPAGDDTVSLYRKGQIEALEWILSVLPDLEFVADRLRELKSSPEADDAR
jgi:hypothetical protein